MATKKKAKAAATNGKLGWHFLPADMRLEYGDNRLAKVGESLSVPSHITPRPCHEGMHASEKPVDAASFKKGPVLCRVEVSGEIKKENDKFCGRSRKILSAKTLTANDIRKLAKDCGLTPSFDQAYYGDLKNAGLDEMIRLLGRLNGYDSALQAKANAWLEKWIEGKVETITFKKMDLTEDAVKKFLTTRIVRTAAELRKDMKDMYELDDPNGTSSTLEDMLADLAGSYGDVCNVENYTEGGGDGYVLKLKRKR